MCDRVNAANARIQAANQGHGGQRPDAAGRPGEAAETADHRERAGADHDQVTQSRLRGHLAKVKQSIKTGKAQLDATDAIQNAGMAESNAREAIDSAEDAIDIAEDAVLDALRARAAADVLAF